MLVHAGEVEINAEVHGEANVGTPVVFLHGIGGNGSNWAPQVEALAAARKVVTIDSRGFGGSEVAGRDLALEDYAADVLRALDALGIDRAHVVGLSMGGMMGQALALEASERVASLVLADTSAQADEQMAANLKASGAAALEHGMSAVAEMFMPATFCAAAIEEDREYVRTFKEAFIATDAGAFDMGLNAIAGLDFLDRLDQVAGPVLVIVGSDDALTPVAHAEAIAARIPGARLEVIQGAGHLSNLDDPETFTRLLTEFLEA